MKRFVTIWPLICILTLAIPVAAKYRGQTYQILCGVGGLNYNNNPDRIPATAMIPPSRNVNSHRGGWGSRGGTSLVNSGVYTGTPQIMGLYDFRLRNGNQFTMAATDNGEVYKNEDTTITTAMSDSGTYYDFETFENELYIVDGKTTPQKWNGSDASSSVITSIPSDWTGNNNPQWVIKHGFGNSERLWFGGCPTTPQSIYASANGNGDDISDANVIVINIETGDGHGLVGAVEFGDRLIVFGKTRAFVINDTSPDTSNWGYEATQWSGGVANQRLIVRLPNDIVCMTDSGDIYSVTAVQSYGDYKAVSLTRPAFIDSWIQDKAALSRINQFHAIYDPNLRAIKFFVVRTGQTQINTALVYFIDKGAEAGWVVHDNQSYASGYSASVSALVNTGKDEVYTGDYDGRLWKLEQVNKNDNNNGYYAGFKTAELTFENSRFKKRYDNGWLLVQAKGDYDLQIRVWVDGVAQTAQTVSMGGIGGIYGTGKYGTAVYGGTEILDKSFSVGNVGKRIQYEIFNSVVNEPLFVSQILQDFVFLGAHPE